MDKANKIKLLLLTALLAGFLWFRKHIFWDFSYLNLKIEENDILVVIFVIIFTIVLLFLMIQNFKTFVARVEIINGLIYAYKKDQTSFVISQSEVEKISSMKVNQNGKFYYIFKCKMMDNRVYRWKIMTDEEKEILLKKLEENNFIKKKTY